ncbi:MAG: FlgD immunoglobulin-like domain containing protein, partial [Paludibacteraceae bacterium]
VSSFETVGPEVALYMNSTAFRSGDDVNETPMFLAYINDQSGINASGCGIGHDITLMLNDDVNGITVLNPYFSYLTGSYTSGTLSYQMPELKEGHYTLDFKVWDLLNNSTSKTIEFNVVEGLRVNMDEMFLFPNPARDYVSVRVSHDRPEKKVSYRMTVFDLNGRIVYKSATQTAVSTGTLTFDWDLRTNGGARLNAGSYLCKVEVASEDGGFDSMTQNLVVLPQ